MNPSPYFPVPPHHGPFPHPLISPLTWVGSSLAGLALHAHPVRFQTTATRLQPSTAALLNVLGPHHSYRAGAWWFLLADDRTGIFAERRPLESDGEAPITLAPIAVEVAASFVVEGKPYHFTPTDLHDPHHNPAFPATFADDLAATVAATLDAWGAACSAALPISHAFPADPGHTPLWFGSIAYQTGPHTEMLAQICAALALRRAPTGTDLLHEATIPHVALLGATLCSTGTIQPPRFVLARHPDRRDDVLQAANAWMAQQTRWPHTSLVAQSFQRLRNGSSMLRADTIASSIEVPWPLTMHQALALAHHATDVLRG